MTYPPHSPLLDLPNSIWGWVQIMMPSLCNFFHSPVISSLLARNIILRTLFSNTLSL
jgi:hypothetical protein